MIQNMTIGFYFNDFYCNCKKYKHKCSSVYIMISILIPIYNGIEYINDSVSSVLDQTFQDWEIIIGINGHFENSSIYRIAKNYEDLDPRIHVYDMYEIKGKSNALNNMIAYCTYDWIAILDVDDIWFSNKLEKQLPFMKSYDVIGTQCVYFEGLEGTVPKIPVGDISNFDFKTVNPIINSSIIIRKELAIKYKWNPAYDGVEDYDLWLRLCKDNKQFFNIDEVLVKHRIHQTSAFNSQNQQSKLAEILKN